MFIKKKKYKNKIIFLIICYSFIISYHVPKLLARRKWKEPRLLYSEEIHLLSIIYAVNFIETFIKRQLLICLLFLDRSLLVACFNTVWVCAKTVKKTNLVIILFLLKLGWMNINCTLHEKNQPLEKWFSKITQNDISNVNNPSNRFKNKVWANSEHSWMIELTLKLNVRNVLDLSCIIICVSKGCMQRWYCRSVQSTRGNNEVIILSSL